MTEAKGAAFDGVSFRGTFRDYQQTVLNRVGDHLADGRIHIVAAPGSGKTVLGLELVRRLGQPAIVLSPSVTIRQQWGDRFEERFLPAGRSLDEFVSFDLESFRPITSVTYQALHAASTRAVDVEARDLADEDDADDGASAAADVASDAVERHDFADFDLVAAAKDAGVRVVCLDEAHHLRSEWHRALKAFIKALGSVTVIALTATPPYDSTATEWARYESLCGPVDEEIFVPELVAKGTLCPHQDYVRFTLPTTSERQAANEYRRRVDRCCGEALESRIVSRALEASGLVASYRDHLDVILKNERPFATLVRAAKQDGMAVPSGLLRLTRRKGTRAAPVGRRRCARDLEEAFQFLIDEPELFTPEVSAELKSLVARCGLLERGRVRLRADRRLSRMLVSSMGKLHGLAEVAALEASVLGDDLRMLVLTDYIKKDLVGVIGTELPFSSMGAVPAFEAIRRTVGEGVSLGLLTGSLVIVPNGAAEGVGRIAHERGVACSFDPLPHARFCVVSFEGSNKGKVAVMTEAFRQGLVNVLVGTKSLLGEGWDSPCINALVLATFVGSFMLSNQMRGRAIRVDGDRPGKTANIWHLVCVEPLLGEDAPWIQRLFYSGLERSRELEGADWETLVRRFDCFMGPAYRRRVIESGVERLDIVEPPFDEDGIARINRQMEELARDREAMARSWEGALPNAAAVCVESQGQVAPARPALSFRFLNMLPLALLGCVEGALAWAVAGGVRALRLSGAELPGMALAALAAALFVGAVLLVRGAVRLARRMSPRKNVQTAAEAVLEALCAVGLVSTPGAKVRVSADPLSVAITFRLRNAAVREQEVFAQAVSELLAPIDNPKYVLVRRVGPLKDCRTSYACPSVFAQSKDYAEKLRRALSRRQGAFDLVYTYTPEGRAVLWECCCKSFANRNQALARRRVLAE